jgi:hypothetical protein
MDLAVRRAELVVSLGNAVVNLRQAERDVAEARDAEQRVRGAIALLDELAIESPGE